MRETRISDLIARLEAAKAKHGDLPVMRVDNEDRGTVTPQIYGMVSARAYRYDPEFSEWNWDTENTDRPTHLLIEL